MLSAQHRMGATQCPQVLTQLVHLIIQLAIQHLKVMGDSPSCGGDSTPHWCDFRLSTPLQKGEFGLWRIGIFPVTTKSIFCTASLFWQPTESVWDQFIDSRNLLLVTMTKQNLTPGWLVNLECTDAPPLNSKKTIHSKFIQATTPY